MGQSRGAPPLVGLLGYDVYGLLIGFALSVLVYQVRPALTTPLTVKPPVPVLELPELEIPKGAEPCKEAIDQYQRWLRECKNNCSVCFHYQPHESLHCALLAPMKGLLPDGDPFVVVMGQLSSLRGQIVVLLKRNNELRRREEIRKTPWLQYLQVAFNAIILFSVGQILAYLASAL